MTQFMTANSYFGAVAEVTKGTTPGSGTIFWVPIDTPQVTPMQAFLRDTALRGSPAEVYDHVQGVRHDEYDMKSYLFADTFPFYVKALLGGTDTVTPTSASYSHSIPLLNAASTGSQPLSYSLMDFDGANAFTMAAATCSELTLTAGAEAAADATLKWLTNPYADATSAGAPFNSLSFSTEHLIPAWNTTVSVGGVSLTYIASLELKIDRKATAIHTFGAQKPFNIFASPIAVTGKFTALINSNADIWSTPTATGYALTRSPQATVITLTDPNDTHSAISDSISFTMTSVQYYNPKRMRGKAWVELEVEFEANANTTDAASGYSPIKATIVNGISAAF